MKDPVCGMSVTEESEFHTEHEGQIYYFCSEICLYKFRAEPQKFLADQVEHDHECCAGGTHSPQEPVRKDTGLADESAIYTCPMHPEIEQVGPGNCPKCGMALEPKGVPVPATRVEYTCPMHPEIVRDEPGNCPICGMALEPRTVTLEEDTSELDDMTRRFWVSAILAIPVFLSAMAAEFWPERMAEIIDPRIRQWIELVLSAPVVWWGGWIFYVRGWQSIVTRNLNMFTLIAIGVSVAWTYSFVGVVLPDIFPPTVFNEMGVVPVYFEAASVITALVGGHPSGARQAWRHPAGAAGREDPGGWSGG